MTGDRANILCILEILKDYSDENHVLTSTDIIKHFESSYGSKIDRRTVYSAIDSLIEHGYDISTFEDNGKGYFLLERDFEAAEVRLLIDACCSFEYISQKQTTELVTKLKSLLNVYERQNVNAGIVVNPNKKSLNQQMILNIDILGDAISSRNKVSFTYLDYDYDKKLKPRRIEPYVVNPYAMICENEHYYLVCLYENHTDVSLYRIDMMKDIKILDDKVLLSPREVKLDSIKKITYAYAGEPVAIRLKCDKVALRYVIEKFGSDVTIIEDKDGKGGFEACFNAAPEGIVYWALQYMQHIEVISPTSLRDKVIQTILNNKYGVK